DHWRASTAGPGAITKGKICGRCSLLPVRATGTRTSPGGM
ncbi:MAG: hypothetical protein AVDCRST_MAG93-1767, partial [uncultured Chloroflexia bacterium]